jgi:tRNA G18 (ribose-2'-O)-methylase SpoU
MVRTNPTVITSRQHPIVKEFRELARGDSNLMLLDGWHLLTEAATAQVPVEKIAICGPPSAAEQRIVDRLRRNGAQIVDVSGTVLNALSPGCHRPAGSRQRRRDYQVRRRRRRYRRGPR